MFISPTRGRAAWHWIRSTAFPLSSELFYNFLPHSSEMAAINWRTINIDALDPECATNFPIESLAPPTTPSSIAEAQHLSSQIRQLLRSGDTEGALRGALEYIPYGGDSGAKVGTRRCLTLRKMYRVKRENV